MNPLAGTPMRFSWLLTLSFAVNVGLVLALWLGHARTAELDATPRAGAVSRRAEQGTVPTARAPGGALVSGRRSLWEPVGRREYKGALAELRAAGCPATVIQDIIVGALNREYGPRLSALRRAPSRFWEPVQRRKSMQIAAEVQREKQARLLEAERNNVVQDLFGLEWATIEPNLTGKPDRYETLVEPFAEGVRPKARQVLARFEEMERDLIQGAGGTLGLPETRELERLYKDKIEELSRFLSPQELEAYEMRTSSTAEHLRQIGLVGFNPTEEEFRAIFRCRKEFDAQQAEVSPDRLDANGGLPLWEAHYAMEQQLERALGETRYAEYRRSQDYTFRGLLELTDHFDLPSDTAVQVHGLRETALQQIRSVSQDPAVTPDERRGVLQTVRVTTENSVRKLLGDEAYRRYTHLQIGEWLAEIGHD